MDEQNVLHITLAGALDSDLDTPQKFNELPMAERTRLARQALARAGAINVREAPGSLNLVEGPPVPGRAMDAAPRERLSAEDAAIFRGLLKRLEARRRRSDQVAADSDETALNRGVEETRAEGERGFHRGPLQSEAQPGLETLADRGVALLRAGKLEALLADPAMLGEVVIRLQYQRKMRERRVNNEALARQVAREGGGSSHGLSGHPPARAAYDATPLSDLQYFQTAAAATSGGVI
jgi:hypothetical protein